MTCLVEAPTTLSPCPPDVAVRFKRGRAKPRAIAWFGFSAFWGHLRHLLASAIATDNVDSRQWMQPDDPADLLLRVREVLRERGAGEGSTLVQVMGGEVWIDFVADTGDDVSVSLAVAKLVAREYSVPGANGDAALTLPRGHVLIHGGDLAYPVATVREMSRRLLDPWNHVLEAAEGTDAPRVLFGVPGNHDWYDGLDGFARLCQLPSDFEAPPASTHETLFPTTDEHPVLAWVSAFSRGEIVKKPGQLALCGYVPVQRASYFRLPLANGLDLFGVDRQLHEIDRRQRAFFASKDVAARLVVLPDPARAWGEVRPNGAQSLLSLDLRVRERPSYVLAGDVHHYERSHEGPSVHVVAGGGGAFLQGSRIAAGGAYERTREFPGPKASAAMLWGLPWHVASGGAGWLVWGYLGVLQAIELYVHLRHGADLSTPLAIVHSLIVAFATALLVGWRRHRKHRILPFAVALGLFIGVFPLAIAITTDRLGLELRAGSLVAVFAAWLLSTLASGAAFGAMLALIARLGLNHAQPFAALGLPCFKHFVRLRIREGESAPVIDTFVIGVVDPLGGSPPVLVDSFQWKP